MKFSVGQRFLDKTSGDKFEIYDILGQENAMPSETTVVFLKLIGRSGWFGTAQRYVTITGRQLLNYFDLQLTK